MKEAVLLLGHGSRRAEANEGMYSTIEMVRRLAELEIVEAGFMGLNPPSIPEGVAACVAQGATKIVMIPYFLHLGRHVQSDLPGLVDQLRQQYPHVEILLGRHIGYDRRLAEIVVERVREAGGSDGKAETGA
ncbi:MAG: CbiX/SirB N-terminal domain-containing protein [Chloroflexi bacterium]|nr:CbiX/SirB N-terminal domain-containing protein [Chloroflexota bacterium]